MVELHLRGLNKAISRSPDERVIASIYRLSKEEKNKLQYLKVKFYRLLDKHAVCQIDQKYVVPESALIEIEKGFEEIYKEFDKLRKDIFEFFEKNWSSLSAKLKNYADKYNIPKEKIDALKPNDEHFLELSYTIKPLPSMINENYDLVERLKEMGEKVREYEAIAERIRRETDEMIAQVRESYEKKIEELNFTIEKLKKALKEKSKDVHRLRLRAKTIAKEVEEIAPILGEEVVEELEGRLEALKEYFVVEVR